MHPNYPHQPHDVGEANRQFQKLNEIFQRLVVYSALSVMVWTRRDIGARALAPGIGVVSLFLLICSWFLPDAGQSLFCFYMSFATLLLGLKQRFNRWREFRRGVRHYSFSLGTSGFRQRLPAFLCRRRHPERYIEPILIMFAGVLLHKYLPPFGTWLMYAGFCLGFIENFVFAREENEQRDLVDGMVRSEVQTETVDKFSEPTPAASYRQQASGSIPTGLGADIAHKIKRPPQR